MFYLWWTRGRDPARGSIAVQYEPPDKLTPGECGTLVDDEAAMRDITATLVDLAVKGYLTIEQKDESKMLGLMHDKSYTFHLKKPPAEWASARPHEQQMLSALFDGGANPDVNLSDLQNHFYTSLPPIRDAIFDALVGDGYYLHRPDTVRQGYHRRGFRHRCAAIRRRRLSRGSHGHGAVHVDCWRASSPDIIICGFGWFMPARTITGVRTLEKVLGFEDFLSRVEKDQIDAPAENAGAVREISAVCDGPGRREKMGAGIFRHRHCSRRPGIRAITAQAFSPIFLVNRPQHDVHADRKRDGLVAAQFLRRLGLRWRRWLRWRVRRRWRRRILNDQHHCSDAPT